MATLGNMHQFLEDATLKELRRHSQAKQSQLLQSCEKSITGFIPQGFKANPGLELANAFSVSWCTRIFTQSLKWRERSKEASRLVVITGKNQHAREESRELRSQ